MCSRSASNIRLQLKNRRSIATATSKIGNPRETMGIATAITVGAFCDPARATALSRNPISKLPQSPRKIDAGLKLYRRNPAIAPARASVRKSTPSLWNAIETTQVTSVEKSADPAASPSRPSRSEEHTSELQSLRHLVCRLLLEKKKKKLFPVVSSKNKKKKQS